MSDETEDWFDLDKKSDAVYKVLRYLAAHPEEGLACVGNDEMARQLFEDKGRVEVPAEKGARVIFFASGEQALQHGGSVIIEVPSQPIPDASDDQLKLRILGNYPYWAPN
jgi:hypothetical protein